MRDKHDDPTAEMYLSLLPFLVGLCLLGILIGDDPCPEKQEPKPPVVTPEKPEPPKHKIRTRPMPPRPDRVA